MKLIRYSYLAPLCFFILLSCQKQAVTRVVEFKSTTYDSLGNFDNNGMPDYLSAPDIISNSLMAFIDSVLPERVDLSTKHPELLTSQAIADIKITVQSDVYITFISQGTGCYNTFGFYTYPTNSPPATTEDIKNITYVFPSAGAYSPLSQGDKVKLGRFNPGTSIGFVLLQEAWTSNTHSINNKVVHFCSNDVLNPEVNANLKKHAVLINYPPENKVIIGFEDLDRTDPACDNDFNDLVLYCTVTPV